MPYEHRFSGPDKSPKGFRHDPARYGIFVMGGTCTAGPFYNRNGANCFRISLPSRSKAGHEDEIGKIKESQFPSQPTFLKAIEFAVEIRNKNPLLAECPIYACTDMQMETTSSGKLAVQLILK